MSGGTLAATLSAAVGSLISAIDTGRRVGDFASTNESLALDNAIVLELTEGAFEGLGRRLNIDAATNITDTWKRSVIERPSPVDGAADGSDFGESRDGGESRVVGDEECSTDAGELGEGYVCQVGAVDKGEGTPDRGQIGSGDRGNEGIEETQVARDVLEGVEADVGDVSEGRILDGEEVGEGEFQIGGIGGNVESSINFLQIGLRDRREVTIVVYNQ